MPATAQVRGVVVRLAAPSTATIAWRYRGALHRRWYSVRLGRPSSVPCRTSDPRGMPRDVAPTPVLFWRANAAYYFTHCTAASRTRARVRGGGATATNQTALLAMFTCMSRDAQHLLLVAGDTSSSCLTLLTVCLAPHLLAPRGAPCFAAIGRGAPAVPCTSVHGGRHQYMVQNLSCEQQPPWFKTLRLRCLAAAAASTRRACCIKQNRDISGTPHCRLTLHKTKKGEGQAGRRAAACRDGVCSFCYEHGT